jgi:hypothetical protein
LVRSGTFTIQNKRGKRTHRNEIKDPQKVYELGISRGDIIKMKGVGDCKVSYVTTIKDPTHFFLDLIEL